MGGEGAVSVSLTLSKKVRTILQDNFRLPPLHTVDYGPFIKSQLASTQLTSVPYVVQTWSRYPEKCGGPETFVVHRVGWKFSKPKQKYRRARLRRGSGLLLLLYYSQA